MAQDPAKQYGTLLRLASSSNVPEAIRTSAMDAADHHRALAKKAGVSPWAYSAGGETAENSGYLTPTPIAQRTSSAAPVMAGGGLEGIPSHQAPVMAGGAIDPQQRTGPPVNLPGQPFPVDPAAAALRDPAVNVGGAQPPLSPEGAAPGQQFPLAPQSRGLDPAPLPQPVRLDPGDELPMPNPDGTERLLSRPSGIEKLRDMRTGLFDRQREGDPRDPAFVDKQLMTGKAHTSGFGVLPDNDTGPGTSWWQKPGAQADEMGDPGAASPGQDGERSQRFPIDPSLAGETSQRFPLTGNRNIPIPVSKPHIPKAHAARPADKPAGRVPSKGETSQTFPLTPPASAGLEQAKPATVSPSASGGSNPDTPPAFQPDTPKPIDDTGKMNPLAWALIRGGAALMASDKPFGQALGEGVGAGAEGYFDANETNAKRANEEAANRRADARENRETFKDTQLEPWRYGQEVSDRRQTREMTGKQNDRTYELGKGELNLRGELGHEENALRGRGIDVQEKLGLGGLGIQQSQLGLEGQRIGLEGQRNEIAAKNLDLSREQVSIARDALQPSDARMLDSLAAKFSSIDKSLTPGQAYHKAVEQFIALHPASAYGGLGGLSQLPQQPPDPTDSQIGAAAGQ